MHYFLSRVDQINRSRLAIRARRKEIAKHLNGESIGKTGPAVELSEGLTICSVNFRERLLIELNDDLTNSLNLDDYQEAVRLVTDNSVKPEEALDKHNSRFTVVDGTRSRFPGGQGHAAGLNELLPHIKTRFALFIDPDCFIVRPKWISEVLHHMNRERLAFFGTPNHPKVISRYRYFPYAICMFVDLEQVPLSRLDFSAGVLGPLNVFYYFYLLDWLCRLPKPLGKYAARLRIEALHDVGYDIYATYSRTPGVKYECVTPVFDPPAEPGNGWRRRIISRLPDRLSMVPKRDGYFTQTGFRELGYFDVRRSGWEEFMWQGTPFAFHIRGVAANDSKREESNSAIAQVVTSFQQSV